MIIFLISHQNHMFVTPHLNRLIKTVQMSGHNICFHAELTKIIPNYQQILHLIYSSEQQCWKGNTKSGLVLLSQIDWNSSYFTIGNRNLA